MKGSRFGEAPLFRCGPPISPVKRVFIFNEREVFRTVLTYTEYLRALRLTRGFLYYSAKSCDPRSMSGQR